MGTGVAVGLGVEVGVRVGLGVLVGVGWGVSVGSGVGVDVGMGVNVAVGKGGGVGLGGGVAVAVGSSTAASTVGGGVAVASRTKVEAGATVGVGSVSVSQAATTSVRRAIKILNAETLIRSVPAMVVPTWTAGHPTIFTPTSPYDASGSESVHRMSNCSNRQATGVSGPIGLAV